MNLLLPFIRKYILIVFILWSIIGQAQSRLNDVDLSRIEQKTIQKFLKDQIKRGIENFADFQPSVNGNTDTSQFDSYTHQFRLQQVQTTAWNTYITAHPDKVWNGKVISFGFIYSPDNNQIIYKDDAWPGLEPGQIFFLELRIFCGLYRFPVCFMITKIDKSQQTIMFSYVASSLSKGSQTIRLNDNGKGGTAIIHSTIHKTRNVLRDKIFYPIYHKKIISEVHRNIQRLLF